MFEGITQGLKKIFGDSNDREVRRLQPIVQRVNELESKLAGLSDAELAAQTARFKERLEQGATLDDLQVEAFATVREASKRVLGMRHYDCQLIGGAVIHSGKIAEMKTGEGKTLVATLPVYLNALEGKGVHVVTVNDYLAARDAEWMAPLYRFLGLDVGIILSGDRSQVNKRRAYQADLTYGTNNEFGFDYLRDNMKFRIEDYVQRGHRFAIVDEVDSILIDEARTPLIISGPTQADVGMYNVVDAVIPLLQKDVDFTLDEKGRNITLTEDGIARIEDRLHIDNLYDPQHIEVLHHVMQCLKAHHLFKKDRDYVVRNGEVIIVDEFTGRLMEGRRWSDGLHQAVEAKEKVKVQEESQTYATITYQNLFRMYDKLAGMTGTAVTEAAEFNEIYELDVVVIPTNKPIARQDHEDIVYLNQNGKFRAVVDDIKEAHGRGQPVLVGTTSVEKSQLVSRMLAADGVPHEVLNAKQHEREAHIISQAGRLGAVTISTNMAGRGTDIKLGGNAEEMANAALREEGQSPEEAPDRQRELLASFQAQVADEARRVLDVGGLHIVGTERHESRRVDNQLRGRAGRQGDAGSSRFYVALDDPLMRMFGSDRITTWMQRMGLKEDEAIEARMVTNAIENAQKKVEGYHFGVRKNLLEYDDVMNFQRKGVYDLRRRALDGVGIRQMVDEAVVNTVGDIMDDYCEEGLNPEHWNVAAIREHIDRIFGLVWDETDEQIRDMARNEIEQRMLAEARACVTERSDALGDETFEAIARMLILRLTDDLWKDHLLAVDRLRQGVGIRGYGQKNPLLEYKREAFQMYLLMSAMRDEQVLTRLLRAEVAPSQAAAEAGPSRALGQQIAQGSLEAGLDDDEGVPAAVPEGTPGPSLNFPNLPMPAMPRTPKPGDEARAFAEANGIKRNDPCPCGSGNKFKKCCGGREADDGGASQPQV
ncbi:MAG: preprotein translocase subunit SecA [Alphaproteobacteria bacterium]|nr:preprotein translocase subunit SecA [Alphaproteobacteria bacterium]